MIKNILQLLEKSENENKDKIIFGEKEREITYKDFVDNAKRVGTGILEKINYTNKPIVIFIDKTINCLEAMMGVLYSGNFYTIVDVKSPVNRINQILNVLKSNIVITDEKNRKKFEKILKELDLNLVILVLEEIKNEIDNKKLENVRNKQIDTDPMYVLFTSGSTGEPKGTVVNHKSVITYVNWVKDAFDINENTVFGSQTPFYFSMSILDVFTTIITGATLYIIPKMYFSFPIKLIEYLKEKEINTIYWVPTALGLMANLGALENQTGLKLKKILFAGEVMPVKQLNIIKKALPNCMYANLYGPTETTDICSYYIVDREFKDNETLPIGKHCDNCNIILIDENGNIPDFGKQGEIYVRGTFLASGYYNNFKKTEEVFIQNPLNKCYPELVYKTGDIAKYNEFGELIYISRKDFQIKHMGYRIELGEIEKNIYLIPQIELCACVYNQEEKQIALFYKGDIEEFEVLNKTEKILLHYMRPNKCIKLNNLPYNSNGKIDRKALISLIKSK